LEIQEGRVVRVGAEGEPYPSQPGSDGQAYDAEGLLATPGFVDAHTHPIFKGWRSGEFVRRSRGDSYQQIAASGGGISSSIVGVRESSTETLAGLIRTRLDRFLELGATSIEAKSGYGLTVEDELKSLRALQLAAAGHPLEVSPTLLGAHVVPPEFRSDPDSYLDLVCNEMIPRSADERLAHAVDVFLEDGAFSLKQAKRIFQAGKRCGLGLRIHADQFHSGGGARLAAEYSALSADHMDYTDEAGLEVLAKAGVVMTLLPGAVFFLGREHYASARRMIELGGRLALSTDFNPGSSPTQSMPLMMTLAGIKMNLTPAESLWAATMGGACALSRKQDLGTLHPGYQADFCLWEAGELDLIPYRCGDLVPEAVFKRGRLVARRGVRLQCNNG
jgi:imidazolonepropionase